VEEALVEEWRLTLPELPEQSEAAARSALRKGWRWVGEMNEIAETLAAAGLPEGFHEAAAEMFARIPRGEAEDALEQVLAELLKKDA
jgi:hypothetical protein